MSRSNAFKAKLMIVGALWLLGGHVAGAEPPAMKRTELLRSEMPGMQGNEMNIWVADIPPGAATGPHLHPTPRFVYVLSGAVVLEMDGKAPQTFKAGQAFVEMPGQRHNFRNASTTEPASALGFQYAGKDQPLQTSSP
jgi:quercetin dioxygenase-like cupin family protein